MIAREIVEIVVARISSALLMVLLSALIVCNRAEARDGDVSFTGTSGITFGADTLRFAIAEARAEIFGHTTIAVAVAYVDTERGHDETQLRLMVTPAFTNGEWSFDWRQMLSASSQDITRFRSRMRVIRHGLFGHEPVSLRAFDELFVDLEGAGVVRNNIAAGLGVELHKRFAAELYHVWVDNRVGRQSDYAMLLFSLRF